jgi:hypothetical protein
MRYIARQAGAIISCFILVLVYLAPAAIRESKASALPLIALIGALCMGAGLGLGVLSSK